MEVRITLYRLQMQDQILEVCQVQHCKRVKVGVKFMIPMKVLITVYADATIAFPILALYVLSNQKSREPKRIYKKIGKLYEKLSEDYFKNPNKS